MSYLGCIIKTSQVMTHYTIQMSICTQADMNLFKEIDAIYQEANNAYEAYEKLATFADRNFGIAWEDDIHILQSNHRVININL